MNCLVSIKSFFDLTSKISKEEFDIVHLGDELTESRGRRFWEISKRISSHFRIALIVPTLASPTIRKVDRITVIRVYDPSLRSMYRSRAFRPFLYERILSTLSFRILDEEAAPLPTLLHLIEKNISCVLTVHEVRGLLNFHFFGVLGSLPFLFEKMLKLHLGFSKVISVSKSTYHMLLRLGVPNVLIRNGVNTDLFRPIPIERQGDAFKVVTVGRLVPQKRHDLFILTAKLILKEFDKLNIRKPVSFEIIGNGPLRGKLSTIVRNYGLQRHLTISDDISDQELVKRLNLADLYVHTNPYLEGFGFTVAEALSCGKPVVAFNIAGINETVDTKCGILVPPFDIKALARNIIELLLDEDRRIEMGKAGRERMKREFDWDRPANEMKKLYQELI